MKKQILLTIITGLFIISGSLFSMAQTKNEAGEQFNKAIELMKTEDVDGTIAAFEKCIAICDQVGTEADDLKSQSQKQLPGLYYKTALNTYKSKDIPGALVKFEKAYKVADQYGDADNKAKCAKIIPQLYNAQGNDAFKKDDMAGATKNFDKAIELSPDYAPAYLGKALVYKKQDDVANMKKYFDLTIEKSAVTGDEKTGAKAKDAAYKDFNVRAAKAIQAKKFGEAESHLNNAKAYGAGDADLYYYYTLVYNGQKKFAEAITSGNTALSLGGDTLANKTAVYFELGNAYAGNGDNAKGCEYYGKVVSGPNMEAAKYQMKEVLKCAQ